MGRWPTFIFVLGLTVGCQGQNNPFMRTTVPPPATGVGAPSDPYYNNSGGSPTPPVVQPAPGAGAAPAAVTPVVPPPDKRFSQPGGYNFPQGSTEPQIEGSIRHRKAVDPAPNDYRTGTSAIARAARPRQHLESTTEPAVAVAKIEQASPSENELVMTSYEDRHEEETSTARSSESREIAIEPPATRQEPSEATLELADASPAKPAHTGGATIRILDSDAQATSGSADVEPAVAEANTPAFKAVPASTTLNVAPPVVTGTPQAQLAVTAGSADRPNATRYYFDRDRSNVRHAAQPAVFNASSGNGVRFAGGAGAQTGVSTGPEGAPSYSHHTDYSWLRGKLEYSSALRRWKLRYIPIDGQTDAFGGSVVLEDSPLLEQFKAGDFVTVEGAVGDGPAEHGRFSPRYTLRSIEPQS